MKKLFPIYLLAMLLPSIHLLGECTNNNTLLANYVPVCDGAAHQATACIKGGQYISVAVTADNTYVFSTCGSSAFDSQITIYNSAGGGYLGYSDDFCSTQSTVTWVATFTGNLWVLIDQYPCSNGTTCIPLSITCTPPPPPPTPNSTCLGSLPDDCSNACDLGTLPRPADCTAGGDDVSAGNPVYFSGTNVGATAANPYSAIAGCASPATDVWYKFKATGTQFSFSLKSDTANILNNPNVSLYKGANCASLVGVHCFSGSGGSIGTTLFSPITPDSIYYLQVSGGNPTDRGNFVLKLENDLTCNNCLLAQAATASPPPVNGKYDPGQTVNFCFTVSDYNQTAANWLHGIVLEMGAGWDTTTLVPVSIPQSCTVTTGAHWGFYTSDVSSHSGQRWGPGFYYETSSGNANSAVDNNPGNNYGDQGLGPTCPATFCWKISTKPLSAGACNSTVANSGSLSMNVRSTGDYLTGSWGSIGCTADPVPDVSNAVLACCASPTIVSTGTSCGLSNGSSTATATGTNGPWKYEWADSTGTVISTTTVNGPNTINNLASGQYFITVTDNNSCTSGGVATIASSIGGVAPATNTGPYCQGATISLTTAAGATNYAWSGPNGFTDNTQNPTIPNATLSQAGVYTVTVTFAAGCTAVGNDTVVVVTSPTAAINPSTTSICVGNSTTLTATGGVTYAWSSGQTTASITVSPALDEIYTVTATIGLGCSATATASVLLYPVPTATISPTVASVCGGDSATLVASGGVSYLWSNGATSASTNVAPVIASTYSVTLTDANGCSASASRIVNINAAAVITVSPLTATTCSGQSVVLTANGGATYVWSNGASGSPITVSPAATTTFTVTGTDANGCSASDSAQITVVPLIPSTTATPVSCFGGTNGAIDLSITGGTAPYAYSWSNGAVTEDLASVPAGTYTVDVTDNAGCSITTTDSVTEPALLLISDTHSNGTCNGGGTGSIDITVTGGVPPYTYAWNDGVYTEDRTNLAAGYYTVTATDANLCTVGLTDTIQTPTALTATNTYKDAICYGTATGSIDVTVAGGTPPYTYMWADSLAVSTEDRPNVGRGRYTVTVTDNNNCTATTSATISEPAILSTTATHVDISCFGGSDASITITATGGTQPYTFAWTDNVTTQNRTGIPAGTYTLLTTDSNNCTATLTQAITQPPLLVLTVDTVIDVSCHGYTDGSILISTSGGTAPYGYNWNDGVTTQNRTTLPIGNYAVTVTDAKGCLQNTSVSLPDLPGMVIVSTAVNPTCITNPADGSIDISVTGGTEPYTYMWSNGYSTTGISLLGPGAYTVTVTDVNNCTMDSAYTLVYQYAFTVTAAPAVTVGLQQSTTLGYTLTGTTGSFTTLWSPSTGLSCIDCPSPVATPFVSTLYQVLITNQAGCTASDTVSVFIQPEYELYIPNAFSPNGDGNNDMFEIYSNMLKTVSMKVFNRWGELVYLSTSQFAGWDGTYRGQPAPAGQYIYEIKVTYLNDKTAERNGSITLIR